MYSTRPTQEACPRFVLRIHELPHGNMTYRSYRPGIYLSALKDFTVDNQVWALTTTLSDTHVGEKLEVGLTSSRSPCGRLGTRS